MKKQCYLLITALLFGILSSKGQQSICLNDTVFLQTEDYRGEHFWQSSVNGMDWSAIINDTARLIQLIPQESMYYRYEIIEGTCAPVYSDIVRIIVNYPPVIELANIDSVCQNGSMIQLFTGTPEGGEYSGPGIIDGRFVPALAGPGNHNYNYTVQDTATGCTSTANATINVFESPSNIDAGEDFPEIYADSIQLQATPPTIGSGQWSISTGGDGTFSDPTDPNAWFFKNPDSLNYTLKWTVSNFCGEDSDQVNLSFVRLSINPCPGTPVVYDADGNMYPTIQIGEQCWMAENLKVGTMVFSTVQSKAHSNAADNNRIEFYALNNEESNIDLYGGLYDWDEMMGYTKTEGSQGVCPDGWHVPTLGEYDKLDDFFKENDAGDHLKEGGDSGFNGKLVGDRHNQGSFVSFGSSGFFWTSSTWSYEGADEGWVRELCACNNSLDRIHFSKKTGASVRCIKNK